MAGVFLVIAAIMMQGAAPPTSMAPTVLAPQRLAPQRLAPTSSASTVSEAASPAPILLAPVSKVKTVSPVLVTPYVSISKRRNTDPEELLCHNETPSGSRFAVKVCALRSDFKERTRESQELLEDWQRAALTTQ